MKYYTADLHFGHRSIACRNEKEEEWYLRQLKGHKYLIVGNHDKKLLGNAAAMSCFEKVDKMMHVVDNGTHICLCHYPLAEWYGYYKGHSHIYGHIHNSKNATWEFMRTRPNAYNAGCMLYGYMPVSLREMREYITEEENVFCENQRKNDNQRRIIGKALSQRISDRHYL